MFSVVSFCTFEQYEKNEPGISLKAKISKKTLKKILVFFGDYLEDHPHYHLQLRDRNGGYSYIVIDWKE
mgnify:FL=1